MLCTLVCMIGVKLDACKRRIHFYMHLLGNMILSTQGKCVCGWPHNYFSFMASREFQTLLNGQTTPNNFEVWGIFNGQACKCDMRWRLWCKFFVGGSTKMSFSKGSMTCTSWIQRHDEPFNMLCTCWWRFHTIGLLLKNVFKGSHRP
jgi:hypothetical protein